MFKLNCMEAKLLFRLRPTSTSRLYGCDAESRLRRDNFHSLRDCSWEHNVPNEISAFAFPSLAFGGGKTGECLLSHHQTLMNLCFCYRGENARHGVLWVLNGPWRAFQANGSVEQDSRRHSRRTTEENGFEEVSGRCYRESRENGESKSSRQTRPPSRRRETCRNRWTQSFSSFQQIFN